MNTKKRQLGRFCLAFIFTSLSWLSIAQDFGKLTFTEISRVSVLRFNSIRNYDHYIYGSVSLKSGEVVTGQLAITNYLWGSSSYSEGYYYYCTEVDDFQGQTGMTSLSFNNVSGNSMVGCITNIHSEAFMNCTSLTNVYLPPQIAILGANSFSNTPALTKITVNGPPPEGVAGSRLFANHPTNITISLSGYEAEWTQVFRECSLDLYPTFGSLTNELVETGTTKTIMMECEDPDARIYYTLDGSIPTRNSSEYTKKFKIMVNEKITIKAVAIIDGWPVDTNIVKSVTFATGRCSTPICTAIDGEVFYSSNHVVSLSCETPDAVIRYTLDGSVPTEESPLYTGSLSISETTTIKARAFRNDCFDSDVITVTLTRDWHTVDTPIISVRTVSDDVETNLIQGAYVVVRLNCETEGATIYYTLDGATPSSSATIYSGEFRLCNSATISAIAIRNDWIDSGVVSYEVTKVKATGDVLEAAEGTFGFCGDGGDWTEDDEVSFDGGSSMKSGSPGDNQSCSMTRTVVGPGRLLFQWKADCEEDEYDHEFDHGEFRVDGVEVVERIDGTTGWNAVNIHIDGGGTHVLEWSYVKDDGDERIYDGGFIWVDQVIWIPDDDSAKTYQTTVQVPYKWLYAYGLLQPKNPETAAMTTTGKRNCLGGLLTVMDDYVAGTNPTDVNDAFRAMIDITNGVPTVGWYPDLNEGNTKRERIYRVWGKVHLTDEEWQEAMDVGNATYRFFKVTVEMP